MREALMVCVLVLSGCLAQPATADAYFCPEDDCEMVLLDALSSAESSIHCAIYTFTLDSAAQLLAEKSLAADVKLVMETDMAKSQWSKHRFLKQEGVDVRLDSNPDLMHNKYCVIDGETVITGSFNWTKKASTKNNENLVVIRSTRIAEEFEGDFWRVWDDGKA